MVDSTLYTYKDSAGATYQYGDPTLNADAIRSKGLTFVSGPVNSNQSGVPQDPLAARYLPASAPAAAPVPGAPNTSASDVATSPLDKATADYYASLPKSVDPDAIRENVRQNMQGTIDATNALYDNLRTTQMNENEATYGRIHGINVNAGLNGSDFASANAAGAEDKGNASLAAIEKERGAKLAETLGNIDQRAEDEITQKTGEAKQNQKDYIDYLNNRQTGARNDIKTLASSGVRLEQLSSDQYQKLKDQSGYDDFTLKNIYNNARTAATKIDYQWKTVGNKIIGYGIDPLTNQISTVEKDLPGAVPSGYKPQVLDNGTIVFYPDTIDPTKPIKDQIVTYDTGQGPKQTESQKNDSATAARVSAASGAVAKLRDSQSGYIDPSAYSDMYQAYIEQNPGKGKEFIDNFPVNVYIDPAQRYKFSASGS